MTQRFIKLGEGYGDIYELLTLVEEMPHRVERLLAFHTIKNNEERTSIAAIFKPTHKGKFQPIYICLEGIPKPKEESSNVRYDAFKEVSEKNNLPIIEMVVPPSDTYHEEELYYQQLIAVLRLNHILPPA
ncbi:methylthioribose kinase [Filobacillus milosensis]|uniref:Methylthioribose kinase n=1 Tax=Filobacillus milosensis TaxID=94137 RepID=A0A4Y8IRU6_9BACI|nr:methylthioribose kinase [Filobacillus milosensis]TFB23322.1 methylthioribose kinase [Filobacillus milosensis]